MTISLCMIVRNEEKLLRRALAPLDGFADEMIVVDTGSDDATVEMARSLGATVIEGGDRTHKGKSRNMALDAAGGDWIVVLDADEIIQQPNELRTWLQGGADVDGVHVQFLNFNEQNQVTLVWNQMRIFRRGLYRYKHREHEMPFPLQQNLRETVVDLAFEHRPPADRVWKPQQTLERLLADVDEWPDDPHSIYFLHRQYCLMEQYEQGIAWGLRYQELAGANDRCECFGNLATCYLALNQAQLAIVYLHQAAAWQPQRRIWWIRLAEIYYNAHQFNVALSLLRCAAELLPAPEQHYQPDFNESYLYQLMRSCQVALASGEHSHG